MMEIGRSKQGVVQGIRQAAKILIMDGCVAERSQLGTALI